MTIHQYNKGVDEWADGAYAFAIRCGGSSEDSKDAVQEAFTVLWEKRDSVPYEKGRSFLLSVVYRQMMNHFRRLGRMEYKWDINDDDFSSPPESPPNEQFDRKTVLQHCLDQMKPQQRALLRLRDIEGYSYKEMADMLSLSEQQVMVYLFRSRITLKKLLKANGIDSLDDI